MGISEAKKKIVIDNYFKKECDVNTSIKEAFTKGFELGLKKAPIPQPKTGHWIDTGSGQECFECGEIQYGYDSHRFFCPNCGAKMEEDKE